MSLLFFHHLWRAANAARFVMSNISRTGVGTRVLNFVVDTALIFLISYLLYKWWLFYVRYWGQSFYPFYYFFFSTLFIYYSFFEMLFSRTPGKWFSLTRVVDKNGGRPAWGRVLLRSLLRLTIIDAFFIALWDKPLHDKLSETEVVQA